MKYKAPGWSGKPWPQYREEVEAMIAVFKSEGVRSYLEVGCRYGDTFRAVGRALPNGSRCVACDLPGAYSSDKRPGRKNRHANSWVYLQRAADDLTKHGWPATVIIGNSHHPDTVAKVRALAPFDAVFIDGDHALDGVTADWRNFGPMGRIVAFHDLKGEKSASYGPRQLFNELKASHRHKVISVDPASCGIGIVWHE
jgi:hypothetical protein